MFNCDFQLLKIQKTNQLILKTKEMIIVLLHNILKIDSDSKFQKEVRLYKLDLDSLKCKMSKLTYNTLTGVI